MFFNQSWYLLFLFSSVHLPSVSILIYFFINLRNILHSYLHTDPKSLVVCTRDLQVLFTFKFWLSVKGKKKEFFCSPQVNLFHSLLIKNSHSHIITKASNLIKGKADFHLLWLQPVTSRTGQWLSHLLFTSSLTLYLQP